MRKNTGPYNTPQLMPTPHRCEQTGDPRCDAIESGPLRGRRAVTLGIVRAVREALALLASGLVRFEGVAGKFARDRARSIDQTLRILEQVARLPADPATDYRGDPGGGSAPSAAL